MALKRTKTVPFCPFGHQCPTWGQNQRVCTSEFIQSTEEWELLSSVFPYKLPAALEYEAKNYIHSSGENESKQKWTDE